MSTVWSGLQPAKPPDDLKARVLAAAREATQPEAGLAVALIRDPLLRWCAATLVALVVANALVVWEVRLQVPPPKVADAGDGLAVPAETGQTVTEQLHALALES
jgi:hypothetical protein